MTSVAKWLLLLFLLSGVLLGSELIFIQLLVQLFEGQKERSHLNSAVAVKRPVSIPSASCGNN